MICGYRRSHWEYAENFFCWNYRLMKKPPFHCILSFIRWSIYLFLYVFLSVRPVIALLGAHFSSSVQGTTVCCDCDDFAPSTEACLLRTMRITESINNLLILQHTYTTFSSFPLDVSLCFCCCVYSHSFYLLSLLCLGWLARVSWGPSLSRVQTNPRGSRGCLCN